MFDQLGILPLNLLWQCLAFLLLIYLLYKFAYAPILKMLDERANRISESMDQAESIKIANQEAAKKAEQIISERRHSARYADAG